MGIWCRQMCYTSSENRINYNFEGITLPDGRVMNELNERESYKYLGIQQDD